jgi:ATP/ADP translocase
MSLLSQLSRWVDVRPGEIRVFLLSTLGAFLVLSFVVASRAIRDAFFLDEFSYEALPYITVVVAAIGLPAIGLFTRFLSRREPAKVYGSLLLFGAAGLVVLQLFTDTRPAGDDFWVGVTTVAFYLWTAIGTLLLTSGFWIVTAEHFVLRDAKRLFGLISAGGTLGAMLTGLAMAPLAGMIGNRGLVALLTVCLLALWVQQRAMPPSLEYGKQDPSEGGASLGESLALVVRNPHLRGIALVVGVATMASFMVDYQFKGAVEAAFTTDEEFAGFFGRFYGVTGVIALLLQVLVAPRLLSSAGVGPSLAVLPMVLLLGSTSLLFLPGLYAATMVRGADNALRRSVHRTVIEYLYVPIAPSLRRRTKTFIDSSVDSGAEGVAALVVGVLIAAGMDSRGISLLVAGLALVFLALTRTMGSTYFQTLLSRLQEHREEIEDEGLTTQFVAGEATMTMTQFDMKTVLTQTGLLPATGASAGGSSSGDSTGPEQEEDPTERLMTQLADPDPVVAATALHADFPWGPAQLGPLLRLLARDALSRRAARVLAGMGPVVVPGLAEALSDESADFVIRRRIPRVLADIADTTAEEALLGGLEARRFEVRYRSGVALARRHRSSSARAPEFADRIWRAVREELGHERPIWELQRLLDDQPTTDDLVSGRVYGRGELSLEHSFRLLSMVMDAGAVRTAFHGIVMGDHALKSLSLEYLEQTLPPDVRARLWPFIGDISDLQRRQQLRPMEEVVADLLKTGATLFADESDREMLRQALSEETED